MSVVKITDNGFYFSKNESHVVDAREHRNGCQTRKWLVPRIGSRDRERRELRVSKRIHDRTCMKNLDIGTWKNKSIVKNGKMHLIDIKCNNELWKCDVCVMGKLERALFSRSTSISLNALELIHTDTRGPMRMTLLSGYRYFAIFVDDKTRYCEVAFIEEQNFRKFQSF